MNSFELIGHVTMGLFAIGMLLFLLMIFKGVKKVKKRGRKAGKRLRKFNDYLKSLSK
jgi:4-hydroxybenzoate polyprenyltransferase